MISSGSILSSKHYLIDVRKKRETEKRASKRFLVTRIDQLQPRHPSIVRMEKKTRHQTIKGRTKETFRTQKIPQIMFSCQMISSGSISSSKHHLVKAKKKQKSERKNVIQRFLATKFVQVQPLYRITFRLQKIPEDIKRLKVNPRRRRSPKSEEEFEKSSVAKWFHEVQSRHLNIIWSTSEKKASKRFLVTRNDQLQPRHPSIVHWKRNQKTSKNQWKNQRNAQSTRNSSNNVRLPNDFIRFNLVI